MTADCLDLVIKSQVDLKTHHFSYLYGSGYPLMIALGVVFTAIGQCVGITDNVLSVNFISVLFGSITVVILYLLVRQFSDTLTSLTASLILSFNPIFIDVSTYGISHVPALCFFLLGLLSMVSFPKNRSTYRLLLSALCFALMGAARLQDLILLLPFIFTVLILKLRWDHKNIQPSKLFLFTSTLTLIVILFYCPYFLFDYPNYSLQFKSFWHSGMTENFKGLFSSSLLTSFSYMTNAFTPVGIICYGAGLIYLIWKGPKLILLTILWLVIPISFYGNVSSSVPRFFTIILPAIIIPMSFFLTYLYQKKNNILKVLALVISLIIIFCPLTKTMGTFIRRHHHALIVDYSRWVEKVTEPNALIICSDDGPFIIHYAHRKILIKPIGTKTLANKELIVFKRIIDQALNSKTPVYATEMGLAFYDFKFEFRKFMQKNYCLTSVGRKPVELWHKTPFNSQFGLAGLIKVERKP